MEDSHLVRFLLSCCAIALFAIPAASSTTNDESLGRIVYDQRQSGKFNIHVSIKDVAIIEMDQNEFIDESINDEDYYYDENDLTVKPLPSWMTKPTSTVATSSMSTTVNLQPNDTTTQSIDTDAPQGSISIPLITRYPPNSTYSPNLLADLAATQAAATIANVSSLTTKRPPSISAKPYGTKKTTNVIILSTSPTPSTATANATSTHTPTTDISALKARSKDVSPMHIVLEPVLHPGKEHENYSSAVQKQSATTEKETFPSRSSKRDDHDSKIFKFKVRRAHKQVMTPPAYPIPYRYRSYGQRRCRSGHFRDESGNCRVKRSSSILRKLFSMLVSLPFNESDDADDAAE